MAAPQPSPVPGEGTSVILAKEGRLRGVQGFIGVCLGTSSPNYSCTYRPLKSFQQVICILMIGVIGTQEPPSRLQASCQAP